MENVCTAGENAVDAFEHGLPAYAAALLIILIKLWSKASKEFIKNLDVMSEQFDRGYII